MELKFGNHRNKALQKDWNEKGEDSFVFEVLSELKSKNEENVNYQKDLQILQEMVVNEFNIKTDSIYK